MITLALTLLTGCAFTPEWAVIQEVLEMGRRWHDSQQMKADTIQVLQTQSLRDDVIVLVTFQAVRNNGQLSECVFMYEAKRDTLEWTVGGGGGGCGLPGGMGEPIGIGAGRHHSFGEDSYSCVDGLVYDDEVEAVQVTWGDGERQCIEVVNDSYLIVREGSHEYAEIRALDTDGEVIYTHERPEPATGKEVP